MANNNAARAKDLFNRCADLVGIPNASEFTTEAEADAVLGPKMERLYADFEKVCEIHGLNAGDCLALAMPPYLQAKGWVVDDNNVIQTGCVEKK